jgi:hypothetical protein
MLFFSLDEDGNGKKKKKMRYIGIGNIPQEQIEGVR